MARLTQKSFTGGELSPSLYARNDLAKYANGLKTLLNGFVRAEGCVSNRAGLEYVCEVKDSSKKTRIIPFSFNTEQTYIIELGEKYARYIMDGGQIINEGNTPVETETPFITDDLFMLKFAQSADVLTICHKNYTPRELSRRSHYDWTMSNIITAPLISAPTGLTAAWTGSTSSNTRNYTYVVTAVMEESYEESESSQQVTVRGHLESYWTTAEYVTLNWTAVENAVEYNIYKSVNGIFGFIGTAAETSFTDDKIEPDMTSTAPISKDPFENDNNPSCVNYFQQRKMFGCLKNAPQALVTSQTGTDNNFNISRPLNASDSVSLKIHEREVNEIRHMIGLNDLIVLTSGGEWKINGTDGSFSAATPPLCVAQSYYGCSHIQPCVSGNMVLFVQAGGSVVRDLGYEYVSDSYNGDELTIFANHLFEGKQVVDMAYSKEPYRILWCVMSDGTVNALTYNKKQEVAGWHRHETDGQFESVAVIREGFEDVVYFVIKREINGVTKRYIERMHTRTIKKTSDSFFVDCGLKAEFEEAVTTITGLEHLENKEVSVFADCGVQSGLIVKNGSITLNQPAQKIVVGLPYEFRLETLNIDGENTHGLKKQIIGANIRVEKTREDFEFIGDDDTVEETPRFVANVGDPEKLYTGDILIYPTANYQETVSVRIRQTDPLPITITSISAIVNIEDEATDVQGE